MDLKLACFSGQCLPDLTRNQGSEAEAYLAARQVGLTMLATLRRVALERVLSPGERKGDAGCVPFSFPRERGKSVVPMLPPDAALFARTALSCPASLQTTQARFWDFSRNCVRKSVVPARLYDKQRTTADHPLLQNG